MTLTPERMAQLRAQISEPEQDTFVLVAQSVSQPPRRREIAQHTRQRMRPVTDDTARCLTVHDVSEPDDHPMYSELAHADEAERAAKMWEAGMAKLGRRKRA